MQVVVKTLNGKTIAVDVDSSDSVESVKQMMQDREGVPVEQMRLVYGGKQLEDGRSLADYDIQSESNISLILRVRGGPQRATVVCDEISPF